MNTCRILSCATAVPPRRFTQEEVFRLLGYSSPRLRQIFLNSDIDYRYFWADPNRFSPDETPDERNARYAEGAEHLACLAAKSALEKAGLAPTDLSAVFVASCSGYICPDLATRLVAHLRLPSHVQRAALMGHGCAGAMPLLQRASDFACNHPGQKVLAIAVEVCSAAYFVDHSLETAVGNAICADGSAGVILEAGEGTFAVQNGDGSEPEIIAFQSHLEPKYLDKVGFAQQDGKLRIILAAEIRELAGPMIEKCLEGLLEPRGIDGSAIRFWILHPGGRKVIDAASRHLGLSAEQVETSRRVLRNYGNMSSATILFVLEEVMKSGQARRNDLGVLMALGPGLAAEGALVRWQ